MLWFTGTAIFPRKGFRSIFFCWKNIIRYSRLFYVLYRFEILGQEYVEHSLKSYSYIPIRRRADASSEIESQGTSLHKEEETLHRQPLPAQRGLGKCVKHNSIAQRQRGPPPTLPLPCLSRLTCSRTPPTQCVPCPCRLYRPGIHRFRALRPRSADDQAGLHNNNCGRGGRRRREDW